MSAVVVGNATATSPGLVQLAGDFSGSATAPTVAAISGASPIAIAPNELQWATGDTPLLDQASTANATGANFTIAPQVSTNANGTSGNLVVKLGVATGTGTYSSFQIINASGSSTSAFRFLLNGLAFPGANISTFFIGGSGNSSYICSNDNSSAIDINAGGANQYTVGTLFLTHGTSRTHAVSQTVLSLFNGGSLISGGGVKVIGLANATVLPTSNPAGGGVLYENAGSLSHRDPTGTVKAITPASAGTVNTQAEQQYSFAQYGRITASGSTLTVNIPLATSTTCCRLNVRALVKIATAGSTNAVGDTFVATAIAAFKNVAGTVSQVGTTTSVSSLSDTSLNTSALSFTITGTNIVVTLTATATSGTLGNADCTLCIDQEVN